MKKIFKGIGKVFKKVFAKIGKFLSSKWGKGLMIALSIFTMGTALMAGAAAWNTAGQAGANFLGKFVAASKGFMGSLTGVGGAAKEGAVTTSVGAEQAVSGATEAVGAVQELAGSAGEIAAKAADPLAGVAEAAGAGAGAAPSISPTVSVAGPAPAISPTVDIIKGAAGAGEGNMLTQLMKSGGKFLTSPGGGQIAGSVLKGYAEGKAIEEMEAKDRKETRRFNRLWAETDIASRPIFDIKVPTQGGQTSAARNISQFTPRVSYGGNA